MLSSRNQSHAWLKGKINKNVKYFIPPSGNRTHNCHVYNCTLVSCATNTPFKYVNNCSLQFTVGIEVLNFVSSCCVVINDHCQIVRNKDCFIFYEKEDIYHHKVRDFVYNFTYMTFLRFCILLHMIILKCVVINATVVGSISTQGKFCDSTRNLSKIRL